MKAQVQNLPRKRQIYQYLTLEKCANQADKQQVQGINGLYPRLPRALGTARLLATRAEAEPKLCESARNKREVGR